MKFFSEYTIVKFQIQTKTVEDPHRSTFTQDKPNIACSFVFELPTYLNEKNWRLCGSIFITTMDFTRSRMLSGCHHSKCYWISGVVTI